ncbi:MAG: glutamine-hydrolyzing carbamoyl-phosphate synthase small subunit [Thermoguttaceae bacterium]
MTNARLVLEDGTVFQGESFGAPCSTSGEIVFSTGMTGYSEALSDPACKGQILTFTWPLIGNVGVPPTTVENGLRQFYESDHLTPNGVLVSEYSSTYSHWNAARSLADWLREENVPAITGIDTRAITQILREKGTMSGQILIDGSDCKGNGQADCKTATSGCSSNLIGEVSCKEVREYNPNNQSNGKTVLVLDCGVRNSILRAVLDRGAKVVRVPYDYDFNSIPYDGLIISNGPDDLNSVEPIVPRLKKAIEKGKPLFGMGLGCTLLAKSAGADVFRLRFGHHGQNHPVMQSQTDHTMVTLQHHGFAIDPLRLEEGWEQWYVNLNDGTCEGIRHKKLPYFGVQFHPDSGRGAKNVLNFYDLFFEKMENRG